MNTGAEQPGESGADGPDLAPRRPPLLIVLAVVLFAESALLFTLAGWSILALTDRGASSAVDGIALIAFTLMAAIWLLAISVGTLRMRPWTRAAAITWQVIQIAVAVGSFEGLDATPAIGWALLVPAVAVIVLVLTPQVTRVTRREIVRDDS